MALLPYLLDFDYDLKPRRLHDHFFDLEDILQDNRRRHPRHLIRPWKSLAMADVPSTIKADKDKFQVNLDVQHFAPEEISVKTADGYVIVEGKHEEKKDAHGYVSRSFKRRYTLPEECNPEAVESRLSTDGVLTIIAPKATLRPGERVVPITHSGPVRRKHVEESDDEGRQATLENGADSEDTPKTPQQKKRKR